MIGVDVAAIGLVVAILGVVVLAFGLELAVSLLRVLVFGFGIEFCGGDIDCDASAAFMACVHVGASFHVDEEDDW